MPRFAVLAAAVASAQTLTSSFAAGPLPTAPPNSRPEVASLIRNIPACWAPCLGGAILQVCPADDSWTCACNAYENTSITVPDFIQLAAYDTACASCPQNVGPSDGGQQDISGLLVNICIALPITSIPTVSGGATAATAAPTASGGATAATAAPTASGGATGVTATPTASGTPQPTHNAAAVTAFRPWQLLVVLFAVVGGPAMV